MAGRHQVRLGAANLLTVYLVLLFLIPAPMKVAVLGTAGHPATIVSIGAFFWWCWHHLNRTERLSFRTLPVRVAVLTLLIVVLFAYTHAMLGPIPPDEVSPADSGLLRMVGATGVVVVATEGLGGMPRVLAVARRLSVAVGLVGVLAIVQFVTNQLWIDRLSVPGLTAVAGSLEIAGRGSLIRPSGTATHPIEMAAVLTMGLPLLITCARVAPRYRTWYGVLSVAAAVALLLSVSRTGIVCGVVGLAVLVLGWSGRARVVGGLIGAAVLVVVYFTVPGLAGTLRGLFQGAAEDPSVQSRTGSYAVVTHLVGQSPFLGRGYGTFLPRYWILDNMYLQAVIEIGLIGLAALLGLVLTAMWSALRAGRVATVRSERETARAVLAGLMAGGVGLALFDAFSFPESAGTLFLLIGLAGALHRIAVVRASGARIGAGHLSEATPPA